MKHSKEKLKQIGENFLIDGAFIDAWPHGTGHINDTYASKWLVDSRETMFIQQRINHNVFANPPELMDNIQRVTTHIRNKLEHIPDAEPDREALTVIPTRDGKAFFRDSEGNYWRTYIFIRNALTHDVCKGTGHAYETSKMFGKFQRLLADFPENTLHETIPFFHHTPKRFEALTQIVEKDPVNRCKSAGKDIDFAMARENITPIVTNMLEKKLIPVRVTHNDTKINNVMIDRDTGKGVCVIDLDTVMPGSALYDFGDMVRSTVRTSEEDEPNLAKVNMDIKMFEALVRGYMEFAREFLSPAEKEHLAFSGILITFTIGIRFLTDYLSGDTYFKTHRPEHNLDRARVQFKMIENMEAQMETMKNMVEKC